MNHGSDYSDFYASRTCKYCKALITKPSHYGYCPRCDSMMDHAFTIIKEYLHQHPGKTPYELHQELGIPLKAINLLVGEGRCAVSES